MRSANQNTKVKVAMAIYDLKQWEVAKLMGINETKFSKMLREELPEAEQNRIVALIEESRR